MNLASIQPPEASRALAPEKFSSKWSIRSSISVMAGFSSRGFRQFGHQGVIFDILAEGVEVDFARAEFFWRGREDRAGVVDHADALHRGGMIGAGLPQAESAVKAQRAFEQRHGAAGEMGLDLADDHDLAALRGEGMGGGKARRAGARRPARRIRSDQSPSPVRSPGALSVRGPGPLFVRWPGSWRDPLS